MKVADLCGWPKIRPIFPEKVITHVGINQSQCACANSKLAVIKHLFFSTSFQLASIELGYKKFPCRRRSQEHSRCLSPAAADIYWDSRGCWWTPPELSLPGVARRCRWSHTAAYTGSPAGQGPTEQNTGDRSHTQTASGFTSGQRKDLWKAFQLESWGRNLLLYSNDIRFL